MQRLHETMTEIFNEDCRETMKRMSDNSIDSIVTDPPAGISFMNKHWDGDRGGRDHWIKWLEEIMKEGLRVLKPGGHAFVWALPRTSHWTAMALENAGFEIRDCVYHVFGSGFPKSLDISKAINKKLGGDNVIIGKRKHPTLRDTSLIEEQANAAHGNNSWAREWNITSPTTERAKQWDGFGSALKPAVECWWLCRKPLSEKTIAENVLKWGVGGINIDACRIPLVGENDPRLGGNGSWQTDKGMVKNVYQGGFVGKETYSHQDGRFPSNFIHDGSDEVLEHFPDSDGCQPHKINSKNIKYNGWGSITNKQGELVGYNGRGSASRFFYCAKPSPTEKNMGCSDLPLRSSGDILARGGYDDHAPTAQNNHPTVKALTLMEYLVTMITPPGGTCYDLFAGSGTTLMACEKNEINGIGSEAESDYCDIAKRRVSATKGHGQQSIFK